MINRILKVIFALPIITILNAILVVNTKLYNTSETTIVNNDTLNLELLAELRGLKQALKNNADEDMQQLFPEGFVFMNALYGLSWCNFIERLNPTSEYFKAGQNEIENAYDKINSAEGRSTFDDDLPIPYGAFYAGWSTYLLGRKLQLERPETRNANEVNYFATRCMQISSAIEAKTFPVSYRGSAWPADAVLCIAALSLHDKIYTPLYDDIIATWIAQVKLKLDHQRLIPHAVDASTGEATENARGSSQSLMLIFLREIDSSFAKQQLDIYEAKFLDDRFGLSGVREYPKDEPGEGDVDSGLVVFGMGSAATIVGIGTLSQYNENLKANKIKHTVEALGLPFKNSGRKVYLFGALPMADAFICWSHSQKALLQDNKPDFISFHIFSVIVILTLVVLLYFFLKSNKPSSEKSLHIPW
jgi:hypothetical protein